MPGVKEDHSHKTCTRIPRPFLPGVKYCMHRYDLFDIMIEQPVAREGGEGITVPLRLVREPVVPGVHLSVGSAFEMNSEYEYY